MIDNIDVGTPVAILDVDHLRRDVVVFTTVARLTKTQIVLDNGARFRRSDQRQPSGQTWKTDARLIDPQSDQAQRAHLGQRIRAVRARIAEELRTWPDDPAVQAEAATRIASLAGRLVDLTAAAVNTPEG